MAKITAILLFVATIGCGLGLVSVVFFADHLMISDRLILTGMFSSPIIISIIALIQVK